MDYKELLKKYWFVGLMAIVLIVFICVYTVQSFSNREVTVSGKTVDGKDVVYSIDDNNVFADDIYNDLNEQTGVSNILAILQKLAISSYETTDEMNDLATQYAAYYIQQYGQEYWDNYLKKIGYPNGSQDLVEFFINDQKTAMLYNDYATNNSDSIKEFMDAHEDLYNAFINDNSPRIIKHILVHVDDVSTSTDEEGKTIYVPNPTEEESAKLKEVQEALKTKTFEEVANEFSDDTTENGGYIGCVSKATQLYVEPFTNASLELEDGAVSELVPSEFGYHIIYNVGSSKELLYSDTQFNKELLVNTNELEIKCIIEKAKELGYEVTDENFNTVIDQILNSEVSE